MFNPFWSIFSIIIYILLALLGMGCMYYLKDDCRPNTLKNLFTNRSFLIWFLVWTIAAAFRYVDWGIGGRDAMNYIYTFIHSNDIDALNNLSEHLTADYLFFNLLKGIRLITSDYHVFFIIMYGVMITCYIYFIKVFSRVEYSIVPYVMVFYLYLRSFNTLRSNFAIAILLMAIVALAKGENKKAYLIAFASILIHKANAVYALVIPFCHFFKKKGLNFYNLLILVGLSIVVAGAFQTWFIGFAEDVELGGAYASYAAKSLEEEHGFAFVTAFGQLLLGFFMWKNKDHFSAEITYSEKDNANHINILWLVAMFDLALVPFSSILGIWRGYEYFYLARLSMWGFIIFKYLERKSSGARRLYSFLFLLLFLAWMIFRINRTFESSALMPYVFDPFHYPY